MLTEEELENIPDEEIDFNEVIEIGIEGMDFEEALEKITKVPPKEKESDNDKKDKENGK